MAQIGAAIGQSFSHRLLQSASNLDENVARMALRELVESGLLYQQGLMPEATFTFKHALIRDQIYQSLTSRSRSECHRRIAECLSQDFTEIVQTQPEILAHHYTEAALMQQAIFYWQVAGEKAILSGATTEAISHFTRGLDLLKELPDSSENRQKELMLLMSLGPALLYAKGSRFLEAEKSYNRALELCRRDEDGPYLFPAVWGLATFYYFRGDFKIHRELTEQLLRLAERSGELHHRIIAYFGDGDLKFITGEIVAGRTLLEKAVSLLDAAGQISWPQTYGVDIGLLVLERRALALWYSGYPDQALKRSSEALEFADGLADPFSLAIALLFAAYIHKMRREVFETWEYAEAAIDLSEKNDFPFLLAQGLVLRGWAKALSGDGQGGVQEILRGLDMSQTFGIFVLSVEGLTWLAEAYAIVGDTQGGLTTLHQALDELERLGEPHLYTGTEAWHFKGELLFKSGEAEECLRHAMDLARYQGAKLPELRATTGLCRVLQQQGQSEQARELLAEIYGWFTEGFDTADLVEAKQLLDEL